MGTSPLNSQIYVWVYMCLCVCISYKTGSSQLSLWQLSSNKNRNDNIYSFPILNIICILFFFNILQCIFRWVFFKKVLMISFLNDELLCLTPLSSLAMLPSNSPPHNYKKIKKKFFYHCVSSHKFQLFYGNPMLMRLAPSFISCYRRPLMIWYDYIR